MRSQSAGAFATAPNKNRKRCRTSFAAGESGCFRKSSLLLTRKLTKTSANGLKTFCA
ncbi:hypothetical protein Hanom_Chr07g00638071 [Helianthus anomalus]